MHLFVGQNEHRMNHISESLLVDCTDLAHFVTSNIEKIIAEDRCEETTPRDLINKDQGGTLTSASRIFDFQESSRSRRRTKKEQRVLALLFFCYGSSLF